MERGALTERIAMLERRVVELETELSRAASRVAFPSGARPGELVEQDVLLAETERVAQLGTWVWDLKTGVVNWSDGLYRILGYDPNRDAPTADNFFAAIHPDDADRLRALGAKNAADGIADSSETRVVRPSGEIRDVIIDGSPVRDASGATVGVIGTVLDVTARREAERALRASESLLRQAQHIARVGSFSWSFETNRMEWSEELFRIFGTESTVAPSLAEFLAKVHPDDRERVEHDVNLAVTGGATAPTECRLVRADETPRWIQIDSQLVAGPDGRPQGMVGTVRDLTARKKLEDQLRHSQKMEAIGRLAGGVAHDFNNLLTVIRGYVELLTLRSPSDELGQIGEATDRAAALTRQLLAFSRRALVEPRLLDLNEELDGAIKMVRRLIGEDIVVRLSLDRFVSLVRADHGQIHQIVLNLAVNARDAMPDGGTLSLATSRVLVDGAFAATHPGMIAGDYVLFTVQDDGLGMSEDVRIRALEPFFTTKEPGKGTGLGLSTVFGIVSQNGGGIDIQSEEGRGTKIRIYLPCADEAPKARVAESRGPTPLAAGETLLLVEDDPSVCRLLHRVLEDAGYKTLVASKPSQAVALFRAHQADIALVVTDVVMPEQRGSELVRTLRWTEPKLRALFITGYAFGEYESEAELGGPVLEKPFSHEQFLVQVREVLDSSK
jgi:two-component system cell cycle sensor histidine kinase/response regulator CckA